MPTLLIIIPLLLLVLLNLPYLWAHRRVEMFFLVGLLFFQAFAGMNALLATAPLEIALPAFIGVFPLAIDGLTALSLVTIALVTLACILVGRQTITAPEDRRTFKNLLLVMLVGLNGAVMATDLFTLYIFMETASVCSFILIAFNRDTESLEGSFKYLMLSAIATAAMLSSIALLMLIAPNTSFVSIRAALTGMTGNMHIRVAVILFAFGLMVKGGIIPFHWWVPDAYMSASPAVSVLLGGVITKICGIYTLIRVVTGVFLPSPELNEILLALGAVSIVAGAVLALPQYDLKRMLAYSSISQVGYIVIALGCATPLALGGAVFHFFNHAIFKSQLFANAAAVESCCETRDMRRLGGVASRMPVTGATSLVAMLSAAGIPPLAGFWSKLVIVIALWQSGRTAYAAIAVLAGILTLAYFITMQRSVFWGLLRDGLSPVKESGWYLRVSVIALSAITIIVGLLFQPVLERIMLPIGRSLLR